MSPSWTSPETAVALVEDLLALMMGGYTVEIVPLDLIGPDRAILRLSSLHGEPFGPEEVRVSTVRELPAGIRQLRVIALGDEPAPTASEADQDASRLQVMSAMLGMGRFGDVPGDRPVPHQPASGEPDPAAAARPDIGAMAEAIAAAIRPPRVHTDGPRPATGPGEGDTGAPGETTHS
jgi:hypothetical protein